MVTDNANISGGRELDDLLKTLGKKIEKSIMRAALRAGGKVILDAAKAKVPQDSGNLIKSMRVSTRVRKGQITASVKAGSRKKAPYAHMVEFGTRAHIERPANGRHMVINGHVVNGVEHPGARAKPFMRPAADEKWREAVKAVEMTIRARLTAEGLNVPPPLPADDNEGDE